MAGKGDNRRPSSVSDKEYALRFNLSMGKITYRDFVKEMSKISQPHKDYLDEETSKEN